MSNPSGINFRNNRFAVLHPTGEDVQATVSHSQVEQAPSKIERGIRLNPMQKDFLTKFENMRRDARDMAGAFTQHVAANEVEPVRRNLVQVKKISET